MPLLTYSGTNGIFTQIGVLLKYINALATDGSTADTRLAAIQANFEAAAQRPSIADQAGAWSGFKQSIVNMRQGMANDAQLRLQDLASVITPLGLASNDMQTVLPALIQAMITDSATINRSAVSLGSMTAAAANVGNGTALASVILDGVTSPGRGMNPCINYAGVSSELSISETMTLTCIADSQTDGRTEGAEAFSWNGQQPNAGTWDLAAEGSGIGGGLVVLNSGYSLITNPSFETFTSNIPTGWTRDAGVAGTNIASDNTGANVYRGTLSLEFKGDGSAATIQISQAPTLSSLVPRKRYCLSLRYKASAVDTSGQTFLVQFTGTGYSAASSEKISIGGDVYDTSWTEKHFFINLPDPIPSDFKLTIAQTGTPNAGKNLWIDSLGFGPVTFNNGIGAVLVAGSTRWLRGDRLTFTTTNDGAGIFQEFFRRNFKAMLPSAGSPSISDSLAT